MVPIAPRLRTASALVPLLLLSLLPTATSPAPAAQQPTPQFRLEESTIADIHGAIQRREVTAATLVERYLARVKAYNGACVEEPEGILGPVTTIPNAGQVNALATLNLRPEQRMAWGFDQRKARSMTDPIDNDLAMPDALETAAALDAHFARTGQLIGPLHGVVLAVKDQYDTFDMRTTDGADAFYANDRPPDDATFVARLRQAGAIILAKSNMGEYAAGDRSSFAGTQCNPYDTERAPGGSSGGSGSSVATNMVTCAIGEESGPSVRWPSRNNNIVGLPAPVGLVSRDGMISASLTNDRVGAMCRTVEDVARILTVIAGFDPKDALTAFGVTQMPSVPYETFTKPDPKGLQGMRIGVVREHMDKSLFTLADNQSIDIVERALDDLRGLGAAIVDPGEGGALFQSCVDKYTPSYRNAVFISQFRSVFPADADHIPMLVNMFLDPSQTPQGPTIRNLGPTQATGSSKYFLDLYLAERGDANIRSTTDLIEKSNFYMAEPGTRFTDKRGSLENNNAATTLDLRDTLANRFALQQIVLECMAEQQLDAVTYPTGNIPAYKHGTPTEPDANNRPIGAWTLLPQNGFSVITVPAGFTTEVYDRAFDESAPGGSVLVGPVPARLPVGIDFLGRPFSEPTLLKIAAAYEGATHHRTSPPGFGPVE